MPAATMILISAAGLVAFALAALIYFVFKRRRRERLLEGSFAQPASQPTRRARGGCVIAYHPEACEIGEAILREGGNAFDAFTAAAAAEYVLAEGATSLAGPLGVLTYHAHDGQVAYLDADFNDPLDASRRASANGAERGKAVLVPGAPAGLEALANRYGRLPLSELFESAIALAEDGFPVNQLMSNLMAGSAKVLKKSKYGRSTFFPDGRMLKVGEILRQPEVAEFLRRLGTEGAAYVYNGDWGDRFLSAVETNGGYLTAQDLAHYSAKWCVPWTTAYRDYTMHSSSGHSYGGLWVLLALKTLEHTTLPATPRYWEDAELLEKILRIHRQVWSETDIFNYRVLDDREVVQSMLTPEYGGTIWERVRNKDPFNVMGLAGSHSYHIIATDDEGNIASGTTSIYADPWADGIFVQGIPLTSSGTFPWHTEPGERRLSPFSIHLAFHDGQPRIAVGSFSNSLVETSFQFLIKLLDYRMSVRDAVSTPRFGTFPAKASWRKITLKNMSLKLDTNWLDPRVDRSIVKRLGARGIKVEQKGFVDTGLGVAMRIRPGEGVEGITAPLPYLSNPFKSSAW